VPRRLGALAGSGEVGLALLVLLFAAAFAALTPGFASPFNLYALSRAFAINAVIGLAMMVVIVTGGLNLALGAIGVSAVMLGGWLMQEAGAPVPAGIAGRSSSARCWGSRTGSWSCAWASTASWSRWPP
jgi:ribose transport system permease protein